MSGTKTFRPIMSDDPYESLDYPETYECPNCGYCGSLGEFEEPKPIKRIRIGIVGTFEIQKVGTLRLRTLNSLLSHFGFKYDDIEIHHSGCVGVDAHVHMVANQKRHDGVRVIVHPPKLSRMRDPRLMQVFKRDSTLEPSLLPRKDIVDACDVLIAVPAIPELPLSELEVRDPLEHARRSETKRIII